MRLQLRITLTRFEIYNLREYHQRNALVVLVYQLHLEGPSEEYDEDEQTHNAVQWALPSAHFQGLWESLIYDTNIKDDLLQYATSTLLFSDHKVDSNLISWNKTVLLHGPPGTGKVPSMK